MGEPLKTVLYDRHTAFGANIVEFGGWAMPIHYASGIVEEHLATRRGAGLFDVSRMGRFFLRGKHALDFLQHTLTNMPPLSVPWTSARSTRYCPMKQAAPSMMRTCPALPMMGIFSSSMPPIDRKTGRTFSHI